MIDLYIKIGNDLISGRNIQTVYFRKHTHHVTGEEHETATVTYLCGERQIIHLPTPTTVDSRNVILNKIIAIQEAGCYPQKEPCDLGIESLN